MIIIMMMKNHDDEDFNHLMTLCLVLFRPYTQPGQFSDHHHHHDKVNGDDYYHDNGDDPLCIFFHQNLSIHSTWPEIHDDQLSDVMIIITMIMVIIIMVMVMIMTMKMLIIF